MKTKYLIIDVLRNEALQWCSLPITKGEFVFATVGQASFLDNKEECIEIIAAILKFDNDRWLTVQPICVADD